MNHRLYPDQAAAASLHFHNGDSRAGTEVREALERAGIRLSKQEAPSEHCPLIICFSEFDDSLVAAVRERTREMSDAALAVALAGCAMRPGESWRLLHAGAADVVAWNGGESTADQIKARLERWAELDQLCDSPEVRDTLVGDSLVWRRLVRHIVEAARFTRTPILLMGESGTGKELLARVVHAMGSSGNRGLVTVDCTTIVPELAGSELFGHEKGAFTGSAGAREGAFALAHGGTLFLDEVGELPPALQAQLLRVVQEGTYKRVGGNVWQTTEFRLVCATNRDLKEQVARGDFRLDLYYRIAGWVFHTTPLRDRREDILPLANHFLRAFQNGHGASELDAAVRHYLVTREYPGNIRDLRQLLQRMAQRHVGAGPVTPGDIPEEDRPGEGDVPAGWVTGQLDQAVAEAIAMGAGLRDIAQATTESAIRIAVQSERGNLQKAAKRLGVTDRALQMRKASGKF